MSGRNKLPFTQSQQINLFLRSYTRTDAAIFYERGKFHTAVNFRNLMVNGKTRY
ncbi:hypothetical protein IQ255_21920 [Pleurocapsales cyanobacterium LEGE 10410]|nr:hypothetical protein [Pleurocapsales cyanobacterium LEGE 10410]